MIKKDLFKKIILIKKLNSSLFVNKFFINLNYKVLNIFLKLKVNLYNGKFFSKKYLLTFLKGFKMGEFIWTRKIAIYKNKQNKKKLKKKK